MASEENTKFRQEFGLRVTNLLNRLLKAARVGKDRMKQGDLDVLTAATMELLTMTLANMPEPIRSKRVRRIVRDPGGRCCQKARTNRTKYSSAAPRYAEGLSVSDCFPPISLGCP